jgi:SAM-dependent methyltransferase
MKSTAQNSAVYQHPHYYALGYRWNTETECDFIEAAMEAHGPANAAKGNTARRVLDLGCGSGRHLAGLARRGWRGVGIDPSPEMVRFVQEQAAGERLDIKAAMGDLLAFEVSGPFDAAICFMDTFRFLLANEEIIAHLRAVAALLAPGGLYLTDFWVPRQWDQIGSEIHQWEQAEGDTTVRVFYLQHPESADPITQTFEDELVFEVHEAGQVQEIRGGRTRTRLIMPKEFQALVAAAGCFDFIASFGEFDLEKPFTQESLSWRMISVLKKR